MWLEKYTYEYIYSAVSKTRWLRLFARGCAEMRFPHAKPTTVGTIATPEASFVN